MVEVAQEAGVSQPRLSQMFRSKQNLFIDALRLADEQSDRLFAGARDEPFDEAKTLAFIQWLGREHPNLLRLAFHATAASQDEQIAAVVNARVMNFVTQFEEWGATAEQIRQLNDAWMGLASALVLRPNSPEECEPALQVFLGSNDTASV